LVTAFGGEDAGIVECEIDAREQVAWIVFQTKKQAVDAIFAARE